VENFVDRKTSERQTYNVVVEDVRAHVLMPAKFALHAWNMKLTWVKSVPSAKKLDFEGRNFYDAGVWQGLAGVGVTCRHWGHAGMPLEAVEKVVVRRSASKVSHFARILCVCGMGNIG